MRNEKLKSKKQKGKKVRKPGLLLEIKTRGGCHHDNRPSSLMNKLVLSIGLFFFFLVCKGNELIFIGEDKETLNLYPHIPLFYS